MLIEPEISGCSIVLVGGFNPAIFQPAWLANQGLVSRESADAAEIELINRDLTIISVGPLRMQVEPARFQLDLNESPYVVASDFVVKAFGEVLPHTPVSQMGINRIVHFNTRSDEVRNRIGRKLAPIEPWGEWAKTLADETSGIRSGLASLAMQHYWNEKKFSGFTRVQVEPSLRLKTSGIFIQVNDHCQINTVDRIEGQIINYLSSEFDKRVRHAEWIIDQIMRLNDEV
jgi:hypothetical protein